MVAYCCVKGCSHNSSNKKKDPNDITSFHAFPTNIELKQKWLRAIGRPNWVPPSYARVCSSHFSYDQINHDGQRVRIKEDTVPVKELPVNSNFEASHVEVCRFCLATDLKMYSLQTGVHRVYLESIMERNENYKIDGLPQFICFECAAHLRKCYNLLEKSMAAQATLLDIFAHNGKISKNLINLKNRGELNLTSPLSVRVNKSSLHIKYDDISEFVDVEKNEIEDINSEENFINIPKIEVMDFGIECNDVKEQKYEEIDINMQENVAHSNIKSDDTSDYENYTDTDFVNDDTKLEIYDIAEDKKFERSKRRSKQAKTNNNDGLTPDEINMQNYFTIVQLSLEEQVEEWNSTKIKKKITGESLKCETCFKLFAHHTSYRLHTAAHDPSRGTSECVVCKLRFKNDMLARSHANRVHAKKFYCKTCPKTFSNVGVAKKHHKWHSGFKYKCASCAFSTAHASALGAHARAQHAARACARCGHAFISSRGLKLHMAAAHRGAQDEEGPKYECEQCGLSFSSEGARRVHVLTSKQHKKKTTLCDTTQDQTLKNTCSKCGVEFSSPKELVEHRRAEHRRVKKKTSWSLPGDRYPTQCEHCGIEISCRKEHWSHVRQKHPAARAAYRPVVTAVCHTCGKGFQNTTKLRLHTLRHGPPTVPCVQCARVFHDRHALARHAAAHGPRAHSCACGRAFRDKRHLDRHQRVHTGETPYECSICGKKFKYSTSLNLHVKTIHYKLPYPPRKKRTKAISEDDSSRIQ